jgi:hypothetical protein
MVITQRILEARYPLGAISIIINILNYYIIGMELIYGGWLITHVVCRAMRDIKHG